VTAFQPVSDAAHSWSYDSAICYALPVLWMTLYLRIKGHMGCEHSVVMATELAVAVSDFLASCTG